MNQDDVRGSILLIDGHSMLNRAFYGLPDLTNAQGQHTGAVYGFLNILFKLLDSETPDALAVAFDVHAPTFRHEIYEAYKGTRKPMPDALREQVPLIKEVLDNMGIVRVEVQGLEADDILGTIAHRVSDAGGEALIVSGDRDLLQVVRERVTVLLPHTKGGQTTIERFTPAHVKETYGVTPEQFVELKALQGDSSDNIPGVPKVGEKTARELMETYGSIEAIYQHLEDITKKAIRTSLAENRALCDLSKDLATIRTKSDVPFNFAKALLHEANGTGYARIFTKEAHELFARLGFKQLLKRFANTSPAPQGEGRGQATSPAPSGGTLPSRGGQGQATSPTPSLPLEGKVSASKTLTDEVSEMTFHVVATKEQADALFAAFAQTLGEEAAAPAPQAPEAATAAPAPQTPEAETKAPPAPQAAAPVGYCFLATHDILLGLAVCASAREAYFLPADSFDTAYLASCMERLQEAGAVLSTYDVKNSCRFFVPAELTKTQDDARVRQVFDIHVAAYLLDPLKSEIAPEDIAAAYTDMMMASKAERFDKTPLTEADKDAVCAYACDLATVSFLAQPVLAKKLEEQEMATLFETVEMPLTYILYDMERLGITAKREALQEYGENLAGRIQQLEVQIHQAAGEEFNINSPKQLGEILFGKMGMPYGKKTKTGYSTAADVLEKLAEDQPMVRDVLEYRGLTKLKSTYADALASFIAEDGRIHTVFHQTVTATGRLSSSDPNLQNIPMRTELGRAIRKVFVPKDGCVFVDADYSQIELRILAHMSEDKELIEAYHTEKDIHAITAAKVFHVPFAEVTPLMRRNAKAVNFGIVYGISAFGLGQDLSISRQEAAQYMEQYFETYPGVKAYQTKAVADAKEKGYSVTLYGRRRPVPELKSGNFMQRSFGERVAMNAPIQGTAADIMKIAMLRVWRRLAREGLKSRMILQIHDELLIEAPEEEKELAGEILSQEMRAAADLKVPLEVEAHAGGTWYDAK